MKPIRQGDVWLYPVTRDVFEEFADANALSMDESSCSIVLAEGEATGHHHRLRTTRVPSLLVSRGNRRMVRVHSTAATLTHEEHSTLTVPTGDYEVRIQREYDPADRTQQRKVID